MPSTVQNRKAWINRMLESNSVPTIWISNKLKGLDPANARRFDFVLEVPIATKKQRQKHLRKTCRSVVSRKVIEELSAIDTLAPAIVTRAAGVMETVRNQLPEKERDKAMIRMVKSSLKAQGLPAPKKKPKPRALPSLYDPRFLNTDTNLEQVAKVLEEHPHCRLLLHGPPGTGKTSFGHWVSSQLGLPFHTKRASDILGPYVGMTEQNLAKAFHTASKESAVLQLDEIDSLLQTRQNAERSWEISQVNELLTQMENFEGIFIASTNHMDNLDQASLRRFDLKLLFDYLRPEQSRQLLARHCQSLKLGTPSAAILHQTGSIPCLTPGDFANVARQHAFRAFADPDAFACALIKECRMKAVPAKGLLGFN
jgi:SpoVK/Ycf46/Vps4 family AAA+-type ATPase